jgi:Ca2+-binding EF-hand superfamily protein
MARWLVVVIAFFAFGFLAAADAQDQKPAKLDVNVIFKKLDANNDNRLSKSEFVKLADRFKDRDKAREKLSKAFESIDSANQGTISRDQFAEYLERVQKTPDRKDEGRRMKDEQ